ncbi:calcium-binding and coiled-coil domain-containing protein 2-like [Nothobranchius furzeri]|uniref:Calcium-binding and coiled-coil domain-containing protein 2-like n=1 Tax=Nothobranchius furzeri TaxID=105023 RepID=A0A9D3BCU1_NOTFU|nr:calcium-binding and coiled-coil domain-containing protein 2-like [Nothobranchius furzeri]
METLTEAGADLSPPAFSQVVFIDIPQAYPRSAPITCRFTLNAALQPSSRDWVGIFKVGWSSAKDYHTFVWVEPTEDPEASQRITRQAVFKEYYLPKDEIEFYQFCYIDSVGQVRGASTPFCFRNQAEQNTGSLVDDELLVITTQDQVDQSQREKAEMQTELDLLRVENDALRSALQKERKEINSSMEHDEQRVTEITKLNREMDQIKEHNDKLKQTLQQQLKENDRLKEKMATQQTEQEMLNQSLLSSKSNEDKYERVLAKVNQLKEERDELRTKVDAQRDELTKLNAKLREQERELSKTNDRFQLLQVDYQSTHKEKEKLTVELQRLQSLTCSIEEVKRENQELCRRLSQQETSPQDDVKVQYQGVTRQLQETQAKLASEKEETRKARRQAEMQVKEMSGLMANKDILIEDNEKRVMLWTLEKNELVRENEKLRGEIEKLRVVYTSLGDLGTPAAASESMYLQHDDIGAPVRETSANQNPQRHQENIYETLVSYFRLQPVLVCRHCQESFPGITENELEQHEQSHRVCPFCTMICDHMEQSVFEDHVYGHEL